jgi:hypothetical protein
LLDTILCHPREVFRPRTRRQRRRPHRHA